MHYLNFDISESGDGVTTLEAMAATRAEQHPAVMAEAQQVLDWAMRHFPHTHGPVDDGHDWQHDLQVAVEAEAEAEAEAGAGAGAGAEAGAEGGAWHSVTLTLSCSKSFVAEFLPVFGAPPD